MAFQTDVEIELKEYTDSKYIISSQHRKAGNPHKSIWTITFSEEVDCFLFTVKENWKQENKGWGIKICDNTLQVLGINSNKEELKLAKFVDGGNTDIWHGYPADYLYKSQDRPTTEILRIWVIKGYITKSKMNKIRQGLPCNL